MNTKNSRLILNGVTLIQKLASFNEITIVFIYFILGRYGKST